MCNNVGIIYTTCTLIRVRILWLAEILFESMFQFTRTLCVWLKIVVVAWVYRVHLSAVYNRIHFVIIYTGCKLMYNKIATTETPSVIWNNYLRQYSAKYLNLSHWSIKVFFFCCHPIAATKAPRYHISKLELHASLDQCFIAVILTVWIIIGSYYHPIAAMKAHDNQGFTAVILTVMTIMGFLCLNNL